MLCRCGCGQDAGIYPRTRGAQKKGDECEYIRGHWARGARRADVPAPNPGGLCQCGCGQLAPVATMTNARIGHVAGQPVRFIKGHVGRLKIRELITPDLWVEIDRGFTTPCWIWRAAPERNGYCRTQLRGTRVLVHRAMYDQEVGPIPKGMQVDHLCRQTACVNPAHLEAVIPVVNRHRSTQTKITAAVVRAIREAQGTPTEIGQRFGLSGTHVSGIRSGRLWPNVK